jgi:uncharacterized protein YjcR
MAVGRPRNPDRDKAFEIWLASGGIAKLKDIANDLGVPDSRIRKWKAEDEWDAKIKERSDRALLNSKGSVPKTGAPLGNHNARGHGAPRGNKNAVGNRGGHGGPIGNKKAVTTGEYETIWFDTLTAEEQLLFGKINTNTLVQVEEGIIFLTFRERRMMERISKLMAGLTESERKILSELREVKEPAKIYDAKSDSSKTVWVPVPKLVVTEITETKGRTIDDILKVEEGLTRVQQQKARFIALKHSIETENIDLLNQKQRLEIEKMQAEIAKINGNDGDGNQEPDNFMDALQGKVTEAWGDGS